MLTEFAIHRIIHPDRLLTKDVQLPSLFYFYFFNYLRCQFRHRRQRQLSTKPANVTSSISETMVYGPRLRPLNFPSPYIEDYVESSAGPNIFANNIKNAFESRRQDEANAPAIDADTDSKKEGSLEGGHLTIAHKIHKILSFFPIIMSCLTSSHKCIVKS